MTWPLKRLGDLCETTSGGTPSRSHREYFDGAIPWIKSGDLTDGYVNSYEEGITELGLRNSSAKLFPKGTVLLAMYGATVGKLGILEIDAATNQAVCGLTPLSEIDRQFLFYFLLSQRKALIEKSTGGAQPNISQRIIRDLLLPIPPIDEQRRITDLLLRAESIVRLRREAHAKAQGIIPALFLDMFGNPATNPKGWPVVSIDEFLDVKGGKRLPKGATYSEVPTPFRYLRGTDIHPGHVDPSSLLYLAPDDQATIRRYVVRAGDVVLTIAGKIGVAAPIPPDLDGVNLTENAAMLRPRGATLMTPSFLAQQINSGFVQSQIDALTGRVTIGKLALERIRTLRLVAPPPPLQDRFAGLVAAMDSILAQQAGALSKAEATFQSLLARTFGGEPTAAAPAEEAAVA